MTPSRANVSPVQTQRLSNRGFGFAVAVVALIMVAVRWMFTSDVSRVGLALAGFFLVVALVLPAALLPLNRLWTQIAARLSVVTNTLLLGLAMYLLLSPVRVAMKVFQLDPIDRGVSSDVESYLVPVMRQTTVETLPDIF